MNPIGFSTGAIALGDYSRALLLLSNISTTAIELSALRVNEIGPLIEALPALDLAKYQYISIHAPSSYLPEQEQGIAELLWAIPARFAIILHPDAIHDAALWKPFGSRVAIENMDRRKLIGRTVKELEHCFSSLPDARFCFDIGHARQVDPSMTEAYLILNRFSDRLVQVHVSEVDAQSKHALISYAAELAFADVARFVPEWVPLILESRVTPNQIQSEIFRALDIFSRPAFAA
ncbi:MAG: hypothetical protein V4555_12960 [Acidobacteriota bacterium]